MVSRGANHSWVSCPSRGSKTTRISVSACRFKHLFSGVITTARKINLHFKPIYKSSNTKCKGRPTNNWGFTMTNTVNHHSKNSQNKSMTPSERENFQADIKNMLKFMNCRYLHCVFTFSFHILILTPKFLKSHVFLRDYGGNSRYSGTKININKKK